MRWACDDGDAVGRGDGDRPVAGPLRSILTAERTALNFLCHLSGVATRDPSVRRRASRAGRAIVGHAQDAPRSARAGEGGGARRRRREPPRVPLRHGARQGQPPRRARHRGGRARAREPAGRVAAIEVECERIEQVVEAVEAGADRRDARQHDRRRSVPRASTVVRDEHAPDVLVELSGGVTLENVAAYADAGVDLISTSAITQSAPALDIGLDGPAFAVAVPCCSASTPATPRPSSVSSTARSSPTTGASRRVAERTADELALMIQQFLGFHGFSSVSPDRRSRRRRRASRASPPSCAR